VREIVGMAGPKVGNDEEGQRPVKPRSKAKKTNARLPKRKDFYLENPGTNKE